MTDNRLKIIVGLDYGTTFSGISYVTSNEVNIDKIEVINQWPGTSETVSKVPTRMAYASENKNFYINKWGFAVTSGMESYLWTKLLLDRGTTVAELDDPALKDLFGKGMLKLPRDKTAKDVCTDYLMGLYDYMVSVLCKKYSPEVYAVTPIECWITVPAIWSDAAKDATRSAALKAGFGSRHFDKVNIIPEPEAAALAALKPHLDSDSIDPISPGENVLVCDCGGGTVDITTYTILETIPRLQFQEVCVGVGAKCGSTYIDRNFNTWMVNKFGEAYTSLSQKKRGAGSAFMRSFEAQKKTFGSKLLGRGDQKYIEIDHIAMDVPSSSRYDSDEAVVNLTWHDMKSFFDPVIKDITRLVSTQAELAKKNLHQIDRVILVGGFGDSDYLNECMRIWCMQNGPIKLTCPPQCQATARRHYGYHVGKTFRQGIDPERKAYFCEFDGTKRCRDRADWALQKGQMMNSSTTATFELCYTHVDDGIGTPCCKMTLLGCSSDKAPDYLDNPCVESVGTISVHFKKADVQKAEKRYNKQLQKYVFSLSFTVEMKLDTEQGTLSFQSFVNNKKAGRAVINYTQIEHSPVSMR
ncbi:Heat shock protein HSP73 [Lasiodiplodia theobromae]|uniref:Heat shock protein HSP73 n=1 Tax=Lasiodiplodia theobromae TaxID=45133 RepID=UPI0015C37B68|nr:Heat shock protein HSP73 [Lasiodiplodia theobromae]KAF4536091.1 Heat shock protein HSP73 [Lasiodiplodia theobromae]